MSDIHPNGEYWNYTHLLLSEWCQFFAFKYFDSDLLLKNWKLNFDLNFLLTIKIYCFVLLIEHEFETPATTLVTSFLFKCNLFKVLPNTNNAAAQCLVCKKNGLVKYCKGKTTSNYHLHMKVKKLAFFYSRRIFSATNSIKCSNMSR